MDKYRTGINMLFTAAAVKTILMCVRVGFLLGFVKTAINIVVMFVALLGIWNLYQAAGGKKITNGIIYTMIATVAFRIIVGILYGFFGGILTAVPVLCALYYVRYYRYQDVVNVISQ